MAVTASAFDDGTAYRERDVRGWRVLVHEKLLAETNLCARVTALLDAQLLQVTRVIPAAPLAELRRIPIWVELNDPQFPGACFHESREWLATHDVNPAKTGAVELANAEHFLAWSREQPCMVLHELAHGYHHRVLGDDQPDIRHCYETAQAGKIYDAILRSNGRRERHYGMNNPKEYFAEMTEAYFGTNDFFPFIQAELRDYDPATCRTVARLWQVAPPGYQLVWADEFNGATLDETKWNHWLPGARRTAVNTPAAVSVTNGELRIQTYTEGGKHFTGMIATEKKFLPRYGWLEARIDFNDAPATWSAFWLQTPTMGRPLGDPATAGVEVDIIEHRPQDKEGHNLAGRGEVNLHWDGYGRRHRSVGSGSFGAKLDEGFHTYALGWTPARMEFFVDGARKWSTTNPVPQRGEFLILSSEVEDHGWTGNVPPGGYGDRATSTNVLRVDYVRVYQLPDPTNAPAPQRSSPGVQD